ncbi:probable transcription factor At5g28040 [Diospyros lotus]|uniref:probable transcription factor At5g28040 n=1 Tax=Diospyros lotus TaxID=55363 RepID=UPI00224DC655|nr:probable transcription factor At5g28040 [Diospyros lotus]
MDSTPQPHLLPIKPSASKLPIKRKTPDFTTPCPDDAADRNPPFKFHRIWTEPDEIRFLEGLLNCSSEGFSFPHDLNLFYARFSDTMSQPYTKSQLSEKLRRLRKKFRVVSSRLARGVDAALLSPHDRALFELSKQLWHPEYSSSSPFGDSFKKSNLVGVKVSFSPTLPSPSIPVPNQPMMALTPHHDNEDGGFHINDEVKLSEVNVEFDGGLRDRQFSVSAYENFTGGSRGLGQVAAKTAMNVFDESLKEVSAALVRQGILYLEQGSSQAGSSKVKDFEKRWREQRAAELDVLARRLRLVLEHSISLQRQ